MLTKLLIAASVLTVCAPDEIVVETKLEGAYCFKEGRDFCVTSIHGDIAFCRPKVVSIEKLFTEEYFDDD